MSSRKAHNLPISNPGSRRMTFSSSTMEFYASLMLTLRDSGLFYTPFEFFRGIDIDKRPGAPRQPLDLPGGYITDADLGIKVVDAKVPLLKKTLHRFEARLAVDGEEGLVKVTGAGDDRIDAVGK